MSSRRIGFVSFKMDPRTAIVPMRLRALHVESMLQGASFVLLDWTDFDEASGAILTWSWSPAGWKSEKCDLPDVIIIAGAVVNARQNRLEEWLFKSRPCVKDIGVNKLELANLLNQTKYNKYLIPDERISKDNCQQAISDFLAKHGGAVVKRCNASRGIGISFIVKEQSGWTINNDKKQLFTLEEVAQKITKDIKGRIAYRDFVMQKYIRSMASDGRAADFRVHVQRGSDRTWGVTRAYVRLAEAGSLATNISLGGYQGSLPKFLARRTCRPGPDIEAEIMSAAMEIAEIQSAASPLPLAELGLDFLLDDKDALWIIETNALPQSSLHEHERAINTIGYALSLVGEKPYARKKAF